jgi:small subunit ribosomal protein S8
MIIDPIGDLLTRLRNAYLARIEVVHTPYSGQRRDILKVLKKNKYVVDFKEIETDGKKTIEIVLNNIRVTKYIPTFIRISKP